MSYTSFDFPHTHFYDDDLRELLRKIKCLIENVKDLNEWRATHEAEYQVLKDLYDDIMYGKFPPSIVKAFEDWMRKNALDLVGELVKMVFFGITDDGYFVAYIPESWEDIIFGTTGLDDFPTGFDYGHLTLSLRIGGI